MVKKVPESNWLQTCQAGLVVIEHPEQRDNLHDCPPVKPVRVDV